MHKNNLDTEIKYLQGVGPKNAEIFENELQISTFEDLLYHFPYKYIDRTKFYKVSEIHPDMSNVQLKGKIINLRTHGDKYKQRLTATFYDETGAIELIWFKGLRWVKQSIKSNLEYIVYGKPSLFQSTINIAHPEMELYTPENIKLAAKMQPQYLTTEKMKKSYLTSKKIQKLIYQIFKNFEGKIYESIAGYIIEKHKLLSLHESLKQIHFPDNETLLQKARFRLKFEELFYIQLHILFTRNIRESDTKGVVFEKVGNYLNQFYKNNLKFELTNAQKRVLKELRRDFGSGKQTNRLLQGDVGSGKTLVALMCMLIALDNDFQACLMAPTEILAQQHYQTITDFLKGLDINISLLTGSSRIKERREIHEQLESGELQILIGTHALIENDVQFNNLGLAIIDEQHRFGVAQRAKLWKKNNIPPHVVVMTATPIPRTLAMTVYGDLDVSIIDELPPGRKPVVTYHAFDSKRLRVFKFMKEQLALGRQIYIVYPLIQESEKMDYKDLEDGYESIIRAFPPPKYAVSVVHGKMKNEEKEKAMNLFVRGKTNIMVATTVIEVGVNVPNASVMIIESAERFGLSQLHQLRGRVGRGAEQSYCILMTSYKLSTESRRRIQIMVNSNNGFEIAEEDLKLRGPGDLKGTQQSGIPFNLKIANLAKDNEILQFARNTAIDILKQDPKLVNIENQILKRNLKKQNQSSINWGMIS